MTDKRERVTLKTRKGGSTTVKQPAKTAKTKAQEPQTPIKDDAEQGKDDDCNS